MTARLKRNIIPNNLRLRPLVLDHLTTTIAITVATIQVRTATPNCVEDVRSGKLPFSIALQSARESKAQSDAIDAKFERLRNRGARSFKPRPG